MGEYGITYLSEVASLLRDADHEALDAIFQALLETYERDGQIFICGNGGSASTASHFACDLCKWPILPGRRRVRATALTDQLPLLTAWANDTAYERIFEEQLATHMRPGDLLVAISGSGNSSNVINAARYARRKACLAVGMAGFAGGRLKDELDHALVVRSSSMPQIEDVHHAVCHLLATRLRQELECAEQVLVLAEQSLGT